MQEIGETDGYATSKWCVEYCDHEKWDDGEFKMTLGAADVVVGVGLEGLGGYFDQWSCAFSVRRRGHVDDLLKPSAGILRP